MPTLAPLGPAWITPPDHPNHAAHQWLSDLLASFDWTRQPAPEWRDPDVGCAILARLTRTAPEMQITILLACVEQMVWYAQEPRTDPQYPTHWAVGSLLYTLAGTLYRRRLPYREAQLCTLLRLSKHQCGHGEDVQPPFDLTIAYARRHGMTPDLLAALRIYLDGLTPLRASQTKALKSKAHLVFLLDTRPLPGHGRCWSTRVRTGLRTLPAEEQQHWQALILSMTSNTLQRMPTVWRPAATTLLQALGPVRVVERLTTWWPTAQELAIWPLTPAGSHLLKYCVLLLGCILATDAVTPQATRLVCQLSALNWKPQTCGQKVMIAASIYLATFPPSVSWAALERISAWSDTVPAEYDAHRIAAVLQAYREIYPDVSATGDAASR